MWCRCEFVDNMVPAILQSWDRQEGGVGVFYSDTDLAVANTVGPDGTTLPLSELPVKVSIGPEDSFYSGMQQVRVLSGALQKCAGMCCGIQPQWSRL